MQSLEIALKEIESDFNCLLKDIPDMRRHLHEELSELLRSELESSISSSINDSNGKIRSWQEHVVGSGGGYAAARAIKGKTGQSDSPGAITNYLENGHRIRPRGNVNGKSKYRPRIKVSYVNGRHFYEQTGSRIEAKLITAAEMFCDELAQRIEGGG